MPEKYFRIRRWNKYQHYKDRQPTWLKLYTSLLTDPTWVMATAEQRLLIVTVMLLAPSASNVLPMDTDYIRRAGYLSFAPDLEWLLSVGFIEPCTKAERWQPGNATADDEGVAQGASETVDQRREEKKREEKKREDAGGARPSRRNPTTRAQIRAAAEASGFNEWWELYGKVGNRAAAERSWVKNLSDSERAAVLDWTTAYLDRRSLAKAAGAFVPTMKHGSTFLNNEGWADTFAVDVTATTTERKGQAAGGMSKHEHQMAVRCAERRGLSKAHKLHEDTLGGILAESMEVVHQAARSRKVLPKVKALPVGDQIRWYHQEFGKPPERDLERLGGPTVRDDDGKLVRV